MTKAAAGAKPSGFSRHLKKGLMEGMVIALIALSLYLLLALITYDSGDPGWSYVGDAGQVSNAGGRAGAFCADLLLGLFGYMAYVFPVLVAFWAFKLRSTWTKDRLFEICKGSQDPLTPARTWATLWGVRGAAARTATLPHHVRESSSLDTCMVDLIAGHHEGHGAMR